MPRTLFTILSLAVLLPAAGCGTSAPPPAAEEPAPAPARLELPATVAFPEGVAVDAAGGVIYTGSAADGALLRVDAASGASEILSAGGTLVPAGTTTFPIVLGMAVDEANRLWVAGGRTGQMWVVNTADGAVLEEVSVPSVGTSLINDVAIAGSAGYFTDTFVPTLWRLAADGDMIGDLEPWLDLTGTSIEYGEGANLNGIAATPDGQTLIVVHMGQGLLFTIDVATKAVAPIDVAGADLTTADGLVLDGDTLYVVRQGEQEIVTVQLSADRSSGTVVSRYTEGLAWPATAARVSNDLVVVNTQFNTRADDTAMRPFSLLRIPVSLLAGQ